MIEFIDQQRPYWSVESICSVLPIAASTYYHCKALQHAPEKRSARHRRDEVLKPEIVRVYEENRRLYGARKVWKQLNRQSIRVARCTVERLMREMKLAGVHRIGCGWPISPT